MKPRTSCPLGPAIKDPTLRRKGRLGITLILWLVLVVGFCLAYAYGLHFISRWVAVPAFVALFLASMAWNSFRGRVYGRLNDEALSLLEKGDDEVAAQRFETMARRFRRGRMLHVIALQNLGVARLRLGEIEKALSLFSAIETHPDRPNVLRFIIACELAQTFAFKGELDSAQCWLSEARRRKADSGSGQDIVVEALIRYKRGDLEALEGWIRGWVESTTPADNDDSYELMKVWRAFTLHELGADEARVREALPRGGAFTGGELEPFANAISSFATFLSRYSLSR